MTTLAAPFRMKRHSPIQKAYGTALGVQTGLSGLTPSPFKVIPIIGAIIAAVKAGGAAIAGGVAKAGLAVAKGAATIGAKLGIKGAAAAATKLGASAGKVSAWTAGLKAKAMTAIGKTGVGKALLSKKALAAGRAAGGAFSKGGLKAFSGVMEKGISQFSGKQIATSALGQIGINPKTAAFIAEQGKGMAISGAMSSLMKKPTVPTPGAPPIPTIGTVSKTSGDATTSMWHS